MDKIVDMLNSRIDFTGCKFTEPQLKKLIASVPYLSILDNEVLIDAIIYQYDIGVLQWHFIPGDTVVYVYNVGTDYCVIIDDTGNILSVNDFKQPWAAGKKDAIY